MINTALVSYGMSGRVFHAPFLELNPDFKLVGSWERSQKNIQARYPHTKSFDSYEEIINDPSIHLVVVNSPNDTHYEYTKRALLAGKHVVTEKAFTVTVAEAEELDALAQKLNLRLAVYHNRRYDADFLTIQKIIKERTPIKVANTVAFFFEICPVTTGRFAVRAINLSRSLSITMLKALALPAARVPAKIVAKANPNSGNPLAAKTIAGNVDTSKSSTTLNFIRSRYPRIALLTRQDYCTCRVAPCG
jgi:hypothetical protein